MCRNCHRTGHLSYNCRNNRNDNSRQQRNSGYTYANYVQFVEEDSDRDDVHMMNGDDYHHSDSDTDWESDDGFGNLPSEGDDEVFLDDSNVKMFMDIFTKDENDADYQTILDDFVASFPSIINDDDVWISEEESNDQSPLAKRTDPLVEFSMEEYTGMDADEPMEVSLDEMSPTLEMQEGWEEIFSESTDWLLGLDQTTTSDLNNQPQATPGVDLDLYHQPYNNLEELELIDEMLRADNDECNYVQQTRNDVEDMEWETVYTVDQQKQQQNNRSCEVSQTPICDAEEFKWHPELGNYTITHLSQEDITPKGYRKRVKHRKRSKMDKRKKDQGVQTELQGFFIHKPYDGRKTSVSSNWTQTASTMLIIAVGLTIFCSCIKIAQAHPTHPMICNTGSNSRSKPHLVLNLPQQIKCDVQEETTQEITPLTIQLYKTTSLILRDEAFLCSKRITTTRTLLYFFKDERLHKQEVRYEPVSEDECWNMVKHRTAYHRRKMLIKTTF